MNVAEWILVAFLSTALLVFLILAIVLVVKLIDVTREVKKIVVKGQDIADKADDIAGNMRDMSSVGGLVKTFVNKYTKSKDNKKSQDKS